MPKKTTDSEPDSPAIEQKTVKVKDPATGEVSEVSETVADLLKRKRGFVAAE